MKPNANKMLYEKVSAMTRAIDEKYEKFEKKAKEAAEDAELAQEHAKDADTACKRAKEYAEAAEDEYKDMERLAMRAAVGHALAIAASVILNAAAAMAVCWCLLE